jgi:hypothetical protein
VSLKAKTVEKSGQKPAREASGDLSQGAAELSYAERKQRANRLKALPKKRDALLEQIALLEKEQAKIQERYASPDFFTSAPEAEQKAVRTRESTLAEQLAQAMHDWEQVELELADLEGIV